MATGVIPTLTRDALTSWDDFEFRTLSSRSGDDVALRQVVDRSPDSALPRALTALNGWFGDPTVDVESELAAARTGRADADWERSLVAVIDRTISEGRWPALPDWIAHQERHPADLVGFELAAYWVLTSAMPARYAFVETMNDRSRAAVGDHPTLLGNQAMIEQEKGDLDRAHDLAARALAADAGHFGGAHPMAHCFFESGAHAEGLAWLDGWLSAADEHSGWFPHLHWHAALHALGLGEAEVLDRYRACSAMEGLTSFADRTSLLWRCQLHGLAGAGDEPSPDPIAPLVARFRDEPPTCFLGLHVVLGLAAANDHDGLLAFAAAAPAMAAPGVPELLTPLARGFAAYVSGEHGAAADLLLGVNDLARVGGSRAQREVIEDTAIEALIRSGRLEEASRLLSGRLDRRESRLDRRWLARTAAPLSSPA